jgi:hypothetical protein
MDMENASSINDVFQKLFKNPTKLIGLVKNIGSKLDAKIKSGDIKESELLAEATDIVKKMKDMPGMSNLQGMLGKMGMGRGKVNTAAMQSHLNRNMKMAKQKERMRAKADDKHKENTQIDPEVFKNQQASAAEDQTDSEKEGFTNPQVYKLLKNNYTEPTEQNPAMNVLLPQISDDPNRKAAAPAYNRGVEKEMNEKTQQFVTDTFGDPNIDQRLFKDLGDNFNFDQSMRTWYATANTQIPNDQHAFAEYLYGDMPSCKEGSKFACMQGTSPRWTNN